MDRAASTAPAGDDEGVAVFAAPSRRIRNLVDVPRDAPPLAGRLRAGAPSATEIAASFRSLGLLLSCGIAADRSLRLLAASTSSARLRDVFLDATAAVEQGASLSEALGRHGDLLSTLLFPMLEAGEATGDMAGVLSRFADLMESRSTREMRTRSALVYPLFLFAICLVVIVVLPTFLMHGMFQLMSQLQVDTPLITRLVMAGSHVIRHPASWCAAVALAVAAVGAWRRAMRSAEGRRRIDALLLRIPLVGPCARQIAVTHFVSTLETLISAGISSLTAIDVAARATGNLELSAALAGVGPSIAKGRSMHDALLDAGCLPPLALQFIAAGEEGGKLPESLRRAARLIEEDVTVRLDTALAALEPLMLWVMGCLVGVVCLATLQPFVHVVESLDR